VRKVGTCAQVQRSVADSSMPYPAHALLEQGLLKALKEYPKPPGHVEYPSASEEGYPKRFVEGER